MLYKYIILYGVGYIYRIEFILIFTNRHIFSYFPFAFVFTAVFEIKYSYPMKLSVPELSFVPSTSGKRVNSSGL